MHIYVSNLKKGRKKSIFEEKKILTARFGAFAATDNKKNYLKTQTICFGVQFSKLVVFF